jgi:aspartate aminotransferase-like enzyme
MNTLGVDLLITAPQKSWSSTPCAAAILFSENAATVAGTLTSSSFACDLNKWLSITREYEAGGYAYHATLPTDSLMTFRDAIHETQACGMDALRDAQWSLGGKVRDLLKAHGYRSVAASGFQSPSVVVSYTDHPDIKNGLLFAEAGMQVAGGVPLMCGEPADFSTFRIGLFGLSKLTNIDDTVGKLETVIGDVTSRSRK